ncbi:hypothetical protein DFS34DRAFT_656967 [Phlyctochytrium arcticum]|nr:hypothetical protein DFS34DRAFT_656967 [Phlyctochytrium arcticum]
MASSLPFRVSLFRLFHFTAVLVLYLLLQVQQTESATLDEEQIANVAFRVQRDVSIALPIDRVVGPGIYLADALLGGNFTQAAFAQTDGLLLNYVKRIIVDIYWDRSRLLWQLCPQVYPANVTAETVANATATVFAEEMTMGNVTCSVVPITVADVGTSLRRSLVSSQGGESKNSVIALILNLHDLNVTVSNATVMTNSTGWFLSEQLAGNGLFTPAMLRAFREHDLENETSSYFDIVVDPVTGKRTTPNGWPMGSSLINSGTQMLVGFGENTLDNASGYNISVDSEVIFSAEMLQGVPRLNTSLLQPGPTSTLSSCAFPGGNIAMTAIGPAGADSRFSVASNSTNSGQTLVSWSFPYISDTPELPFTPSMLTPYVECGFQPLLRTRFNANFINSSIWSWEFGEPGTTGVGLDCAAMNAASGKWISDRCQITLPAACQRRGSDPQPFDWIISNTQSTFEDATQSCPAPYEFSVPRTPQEQRALVEVVGRVNANAGGNLARRALAVPKVWINLHQVLPTCWVVGFRGICPYRIVDTTPREIIGATLKQGIVIILIFGLFLFFKCRRQLRVSRLNRRKAEVRRKIRQQEYTTVPA